MATSWLEGLTWWHVYPLGFSGAEPGSAQVTGVVHRLRHVIGWLDYARELGCRGLQLGPVLSSQTDGFDTVDHLRIDHRLGDDRDFDDLVGACRSRGLRLLMEGTFGQVGVGHPMFQVARSAGAHPVGAGAQARRWFRTSWPDGAPVPETPDGPGAVVALNHDEPAVVDHVVHVMDHWLDRGIDGWRLTRADTVPPAFWHEVLGRVRQHHPDAWFVGDCADPDPRGPIDETTFDATTATTLSQPLWQCLNDLDYLRLTGPIAQLADYASEHPPLTFVGGPDVSRIGSNLHDARHFGHAIAALFTLPGLPSVYYGDEQAFRGVVEERFGGADAVRPMFPERADSLAPWGWPIHHLHRQLIEMRSRHPWLTRSHPQAVFVTPTALALRATAADGHGRRITALLNISDAAQRFPIGLTDPTVEVQSDESWSEPDLLVVPGHAWRVLSHGA